MARRITDDDARDYAHWALARDADLGKSDLQIVGRVEGLKAFHEIEEVIRGEDGKYDYTLFLSSEMTPEEVMILFRDSGFRPPENVAHDEEKSRLIYALENRKSNITINVVRKPRGE